MSDDASPLSNLDEWEEDLLRRYPQPSSANEAMRVGTSDSQAAQGNPQDVPVSPPQQPGFRDFEADTRPSVREFYRLNHRYQTLDFVRSKRDQYLSLDKSRMGIWEAMEYLNQLVDDSDPDIDLPQIEHLLQTAEAIRGDSRPRWFILAGLIHDLGKILCLWDEPQWAVVGDTFPVGCKYSERIVFYEAFEENPDWQVAQYQTEAGIYERNCGLDQVFLSWGHDEYLFHVVKPYLPAEALAMIRYHSCYPIHREGAYDHFLTDRDREMLRWVVDFNQYDLYTKRDERMDVAGLKPYYRDLISEFFPDKISW